MIALLCFFLTPFALPFKSKSRLEAENAALRHQPIVLQLPDMIFGMDKGSGIGGASQALIALAHAQLT